MKIGRFSALTKIYVLLSVVFFAIPGWLSAQTQPAGTSQPGYARLLLEARKPDGLHKAAQLNGGFYSKTIEGTPWFQADTFESLVKESQDIFIAVPTKQQSFLIDNGRNIETEYSVRVERVLKGPIKSGAHESIRLRGGKIVYADGTVAEVYVRADGDLSVGHRYLFMTKQTPEVSGRRPAVADQSIYELAKDGKTVFARSTSPLDPLKKSASTGQSKFIEMISSIISKEPPSQK